MSGMASPALLLTIVALGAAAGLTVDTESEHRYLAPKLVTHRGPPGPAQIELDESVAPAKTAPDEPAVALFGVGVEKAISSLCENALATEVTDLENVACAISAQALKPVPKGSDYLSLLLATG